MKRIFQKRATDFDPVHYLSSLESPPEVGGAVARGAGDSKGGGCQDCPNYRPLRMRRFAQVWAHDKNLFSGLIAIAKVRKDYGLASFRDAADRLCQAYEAYPEEIDSIMEFITIFNGINTVEDEPPDEPEVPEEYE